MEHSEGGPWQGIANYLLAALIRCCVVKTHQRTETSLDTQPCVQAMNLRALSGLTPQAGLFVLWTCSHHSSPSSLPMSVPSRGFCPECLACTPVLSLESGITSSMKPLPHPCSTPSLRPSVPGTLFCLNSPSAT